MLVMLALVTVQITPVSAAACAFTSISTGNWNSPGTWSSVGTSCGTYPGSSFSGDVVTIATGHTITLNVSPANSIASLTVVGTLTSNTQTLKVAGNVTGTGRIKGPGSGGGNGTTISFGGNWTFSGTGPNGSSSRVSITTNGTGDQTLNGNYYFRSITINKSSGTIFITGSPRFSRTLTPTAGNVNYSAAGAQTLLNGTYSGNLTLSGSGAKTVGNSTTVNGNLILRWNHDGNGQRSLDD